MMIAKFGVGSVITSHYSAAVNRIDRMLSTILLLQSRRVIKAEDIATHFEISLRTVYRDVAALCEAGVPVVAEAGVGYSLLKGYSMPPVMFTAEEAGALFLGGELVKHLTDPSLQAQMNLALLKIRSVLPHGQQSHVDCLKKATAVFFAPPERKVTSPAVLTQIQNALTQRNLIEINYLASGSDEAASRKIEPLGLTYYSDHWHLIAYCRLRRDYRDFRTDRILKLSVCADLFQPHPNFSVREYVEAWQQNAQVVKVKFSFRAAEEARRSRFAGLLSESRTEDGIIMSLPVGSLEWVTGWLLSFGTDVEVIEPHELSVLLATNADRLAEHHNVKPLIAKSPQVPKSLLT